MALKAQQYQILKAKDTKALGTSLLIIPELRVLVLTKRHLGSGNEIEPTNGFFAAVNQMFGDSFQLSTTAEDCFVVSTLLNDLIISRSAVVGSWKELHLIDGSEKRICRLSFEF